MVDIDVGKISESLNDKLDIDAMNSNASTSVGLNSNGIRTVVEVSDKSLLPSWYRVYSDGWCEQGGVNTIADTNITITLLKEYNSIDYIVVGSPKSSNMVSGNYSIGIGTRTTKTFQFSANCGTTTDSYNSWQASGYIR